MYYWFLRENDLGVTISVESHRESDVAPITAGELGAVLTAVNRIINRLAESPSSQAKRTSNPWAPPSLVELEIREIRHGSIILETIVQGAQSELARDVLGQLISAALILKGPKIAKSAASSLKKFSGISSNKLITVTIATKSAVLRIVTDFRGSKATQQIAAFPRDDVQ